MDIHSYLHRIGYSGSIEPTVDTLRTIHRAHMLTVPFENLDIHAGRRIVLDPERLYEKIVVQRRGGFCYELNGLFAELLRGLGYKVTMLSACVARSEGGFGPEFDHMTLMVEPEERWIADVGFGESFLEPLRFDFEGEQQQGHKSYRILKREDSRFVYEAWEEGDWVKQYLFSLQPYSMVDYAAMCHYHQTSPQSSFTQKRVCSRATPEGRITLRDRKLIRTIRAERQEIELQTESEYVEALREHFGIQLN